MKCVAPKCPLDAELGAVFCKTHLAAPSGKRGGWLSAYRRTRMASATTQPEQPTPLDVSQIAKRLWMGARPPLDRTIPGFDVLVLCAQEFQPVWIPFSGKVIRCPIEDGILDEPQTRTTLVTGHEVATSLARGKSVLVTCNQGRNRSGLVVGLALGLLTKMSATTIVELVRARRMPTALSNPHFVAILQRYVPGKSGRRYAG